MCKSKEPDTHMLYSVKILSQMRYADVGFILG